MSTLFKIDNDRTFRRNVKFMMPGEKGGSRQFGLDVDFRTVTKSRLTEMQEDSSDLQIAEEVIVGVHGVELADGGEMKPEDAVTPMLDVSQFVYEAIMTYSDVMTGGNLRKKTSAKRRGTG